MRMLIPVALMAGALMAGTAAVAQWRGDDGRNPLDDFFDRMGRNNPNPNLYCNTYKRLNRQGEIVWLRLECNAR